MRKPTLEDALFEALVADRAGSGGLSEAQAAREPGNFLRHAAPLSMRKVADGLIDPKLVLSWLLTHLGAGSVFVGLLVPIREAGALLPQLFTAPRVQGMAQRKWAWTVGSIGQGLAALGIVLAALLLSGAAAGVAICALLVVLAVSRSICSVSFSDVLGKTVGQSRRGAATGTATSLGAGAVVLFALLLVSGWVDRAALVIGAVALAGLLWIGADLCSPPCGRSAHFERRDEFDLGLACGIVPLDDRLSRGAARACDLSGRHGTQRSARGLYGGIKHGDRAFPAGLGAVRGDGVTGRAAQDAGVFRRDGAGVDQGHLGSG